MRIRMLTSVRIILQLTMRVNGSNACYCLERPDTRLLLVCLSFLLFLEDLTLIRNIHRDI